MKYFYWVIAFLIMYQGQSQDCSYIFSGKVLDFHDGKAIEAATVYIKELNRYTVTNREGDFKFEKLCSGQYTVVFTHIGCEDKVLKINLTSNLTQTVRLEHHVEDLNQISLTGKAPKQTRSGQETRISTKTLESYSSLSLGDVLKEVSGVTSLNTGNTIVKPVINGMHSSRIIIMTNGVRLQDQEWGVEHAPNIDINNAGAVSVIKGSAALAFGGDAIGGVVNLKPIQFQRTDSIFGKTILSGQTNGRGGSLHTALTKTYQSGWYASLNGTLKNYGDFEAPDYVLSNTGLRSGSLAFQMGYDTFEKGFDVSYNYIQNNIGILRASHIGNINDLVNSINSQQPLIINPFGREINSPRQEVDHHLIKLSGFKRLKDFGKIMVQYDYQNNRRFEFDVRIGDNQNRPAVDLELETHSILAQIRKDSNLDRIYTFGIMGRYQTNFANPDTGVRRLIPDYDKYDFGAFFTSEWKLNDNLIADAGLRYDFNRIDAQKFYRISRWNDLGYNQDFPEFVVNDTDFGTQMLTNPVFNYHNISAAVGMTYDFNNQHKVLTNVSMAMRPPNPAELFSEGLHHSAARIEIGDLRNDQETAYRWSGTYNYQTNNTNVVVETFYNYINNYIVIEPTGTEQTIRGAFPVWQYRQTNAQLFGIDLSATYEFSERFSFSNKSSFIKGYEINNNRPLIDIPAVRTINSIEFNKTEWNNFSTTLTSEFVFRQNEFPDNNFEQFIASEDRFVLVDVSTPPAAYHLLNWNAAMDFKLNEKSNLNISLNVNNILNSNYRDYLNRLRYFADDLGRNVMLQLKINY